jgi:hypothetical protein
MEQGWPNVAWASRSTHPLTGPRLSKRAQVALLALGLLRCLFFFLSLFEKTFFLYHFVLMSGQHVKFINLTNL